MFTGIVQHVGVVAAAEACDTGKTLRVDPQGWVHRAAAGSSIAVNGCCLTVTKPAGDGSLLQFDVMHQTLVTTTLGALGPGSPVNLEPPITATSELGGHLVQGHIDGVGVVGRVDKDSGEHRLRIEPPPNLLDEIVEKGSIAVDGVSLTVAAVGESWFEVALIPTTLEMTSLGRLGPGDRVNLETDYIVKAVVHVMKRRNAETQKRRN